jgi:hypothetical protein
MRSGRGRAIDPGPPRLWPALVAALALACTGEGGAAPPAGDVPRVMVIDDGFDPGSGVLRGKVVAGYEIRCDEPEPSEPDLGAGMIGAALREDARCRLVDGLPTVGDPLVELTGARPRWNSAVRAGDPLEGVLADETVAAVGERLGVAVRQGPVHGSAAAGVVADAGAVVELVLVRRTFDGPDAPFACLLQSDVDRTVALLADPAFRRAFLDRPQPALDRDLAAVRRRHGVVMVNESFAHTARATLEHTETLLGCPPLSLAAFFDTFTTLEEAYEQAHPEPGVLFVQAAGNDGARVDGRADSLDCRPALPWHILVGSHDGRGQRSPFSNFGACVPLSAPGEDVIVHLPGDWLYPLSGTSFAAPLIVWRLARQLPLPSDPASARGALQTLAGAGGTIPLAAFPSSFFYRTRLHGPGPAAQAPAEISRGAQALWPIRWVARQRR